MLRNIVLGEEEKNLLVRILGEYVANESEQAVYCQDYDLMAGRYHQQNADAAFGLIKKLWNADIDFSEETDYNYEEE